MLILAWEPVSATEEIPPLGEELTAHLEKRKGAVRHASCSAWALLLRLLRQNGLRPGTVAFTPTGKPFFADGDLSFSLSHSHGVCAAAISDRPVGVDIERCRESYPPGLIERSLTSAERASFDGDFTRVWCRKEAAAKMTGEGIMGFPRHIDTTAYRYSERRIEHEGQAYWLAALVQDGCPR